MHHLCLFKNLVSTRGENAFTEALAATLRASPVFLRQFLSEFSCTDPTCEVETQKFYPEGRPDILIHSASTFILIEVKWDAPLTLSQWKRYQSILNGRSEEFKVLGGIISPSTPVDKRILAQESGQLLKWPHIHQIAKKAAVREKQPISNFLLTELMSLLEWYGMKPFEQFSANEATALNELYPTITKLGVFFGEVLSALTGDAGARHRRHISIEDSGYKVDTWKGHSEIYAGNDFVISCERLKLWGWVGCHFSQLGPVLQLYIGNGDSRIVRRDELDKTLKMNDFQLDEEEREYDSYVRPLSTKLTQMPSPNGLANDTASEINAIIIGVIASLQKYRRAK